MAISDFDRMSSHLLRNIHGSENNQSVLSYSSTELNLTFDRRHIRARGYCSPSSFALPN